MLVNSFPGGSDGKESACNVGDMGLIPGLPMDPALEESLGFPGGSDGRESPCNVGYLDSIPELERYPGGGRGNPLQYSCLENPYG